MPEVPAVPGSLTESVEAFFAPGGVLALALPGFEPRPGQAAMASAVARRLEEGGVLLAEAGTGTGKTLAYLVPAILSRQRVLVSTGTKNLQEQIYFKDVPALREAIGVPFTATYMKGRANYLCLHRLDQLEESPGTAAPAVTVFLPLIREWAKSTDTGDRAELTDLPEDVLVWNEVAATAETCLGTDCPRYDECFVTRMRQRAAAADVVIVNHHLLCADAAVRQNAYGEVIPACANAIVDEAHQLEEVATQYFGYAVSTYRVEDLARDVERAAGADGGETLAGHQVAAAVEGLRESARAFFADLALAHRRNGGRGEERVRTTASSLASAADGAAALTGALDRLEAALATTSARDPSADDEAGAEREAIAALIRRTGEMRDDLRRLLGAGEPDYVYFVEFRGRGVFLRAAPIDVSAIIRELLLERMRTTVLTSATMTVEGSFEYVRRRLGVATAAELCVPSEFDYSRQALMYLPRRMPEPGSPEFPLAAGREIVELLKRTRGRAFVLFTSYATMREVLGLAAMTLDYPILAQGTAPRTRLLERFRATPHAVLFATSSFWQGVDVAGEALSCVIIDKLPFASPGDPVIAARIEAIREQGGDPFGEYQVPLAILALQQGLGRLIRHRQDRGLLAILDPRLRTKGYGRRFISCLPPAPLVDAFGPIEAFFRDSAPDGETG